MNDYNKILIIATEFPPGPGGIGNHAFCLARELSNNGYSTSVIAPYRHIEQNFVLNFNFNINYMKSKGILKFFDFVKIYLFENNFDLIIVTGTKALIASNFLFFYKKKIISIIHGHEVLLSTKIQKYFINRCLLRSNKVVAVSQFSKNILKSYNSQINIDVINNGFDDHKFSNLNKKKNINSTIKLITVGSVHPRKGQHNVMRALPAIMKKYPNIEYHIVGINKNTDYLKKYFNDQIKDKIIFHGALGDKELKQKLIDSDIFIMLSETQKYGDLEGFGIAIIEANYLGLPSIGSKGCGIEDAINNNFSGLLVNSNSDDEIILAMDKIIKNYNKFSRNAIEWSQNFKWKIIINKYLKLII